MSIETSFFDSDPEAGITRFFHYNTDDDTFVIETLQDVEPILAENQRLRNNLDERQTFNKKGMALNRIGSIPLSIYYELKRLGILEDQAALRKWLNKPENRVFRTRPGRF